MEDQPQSSGITPASDAEALLCFEQAIASGKHWYIALLEAIGSWSAAEEMLDGRRYSYLIDGEAFDWLLLAERLCEAADGNLPEDEKIALLFHGEPPLHMTAHQFRRTIGNSKYRQYLNYFYGIIVEEALILAVQEEVRKERRVLGYEAENGHTDDAYQRIYESSQAELLRLFRRDKGYTRSRSISLTELKEFTYWLFKYRLNRCEKAKVASDTKKALEQLGQQRASRASPTALDYIKPPDADNCHRPAGNP